ncbi:MAG: hypothetical protein ACI9RO_000280 [Alteromonas macleodii]|jgi:hypothetical protein
MLEWLVFGGLILVGAFIADGWYAKHHHRPLSHMRPDPKTITDTTGMEELDPRTSIKRLQKKTNKDQNHDHRNPDQRDRDHQ